MPSHSRRKLFNTLIENARLRWIAGALLAFSPAFILAWHISQNAVNTPVWDDWERGPLIQKFNEGTLTFKDLYAPHIDHRILFPRLIILGLNTVTGGDLRWEMGFTFLCGLAAALGVASLAKQTVLKGGNPSWGLLLAANLIIFSPLQWDNWLWGIQLAFMLPMPCLIWALVVSIKPWRWWVRLMVCCVLAVIGTHSFGHGFAIWPAVLGMALLSPGFVATGRERFYFIALWVVLMAAALVCYTQSDFNNSSHFTHSYGHVSGTPPPSAVYHGGIMEEPAKALNFMSILAGNPFARLHLVDPRDIAPLIGKTLLGLFVVFCLHRLWGIKKHSAAFDQALPWMALGGAAVVGMGAITAGRLHVSDFRATSIRYISISEYLAVAVIMLGMLWWLEFSGKKGREKTLVWSGVALGLLIGYMIPAWNFGIQMMKLCREARQQGQAALMFINHFSPDIHNRIDASVKFPRKYATLLDSYDLLRPPLVKTLELKQFKPNHEDRPTGDAAVEYFSLQPDGQFFIRGYARFDDKPADAVLLTKEVPGRETMIFAVAEPTNDMVQHPYLDDLELIGKAKPRPKAQWRWQESFTLPEVFPAADTSTGEVIVRAWVFDVLKRKARRIQGAWKLNRQGQLTEVTPSGVEDRLVPIPYDETEETTGKLWRQSEGLDPIIPLDPHAR